MTDISMSAMTAAKRSPLVSVDDYLAGELASEVRPEYLGGYVYAMAVARNQHNTVASTLLGTLYGRLRGKPCQPFNSDTKVRVRLPTHTRFYYPDGMVVCDANPADDTFQDRPVVIAEVVSESTRRLDEGEKREAYLTIPTLAVYLLVETDRPAVAVCRRTDHGFITDLYEGRDAVIPLDSIGTELSLAELYERVSFNAGDEAS
jgi:Uma2 family endonuclease